jgi:hypothetical protein
VKFRLSEYIAALQRIQREHGDLPVVCERYSDYDNEIEGPSVEQALPQGGGSWKMRSHPSMPAADKGRLIKVVLLAVGN